MNNYKLIISFSFIFFFTSYFFSQGNNGGNANSNVLHWKKSGDQADSSNFIGTINNVPLRFKTDDQERLRITEDGRFGFGINNPTTDFHVNKAATFSGFTTLEDQLKLTGIDIINNTNDLDVLFLDNNGFVQKGGMKTL